MKTLVQLLAVAALAACSAPVTSLTGTLRKDSSEQKSATDHASDPASTEAPSSVAPTTDGGAAAAAADPFAGAAAFAGQAPDEQSAAHHLGSSNAGKNCLACHGKGLGAPTFVLAGTIQQSSTNAEGASGVEVRIVDATGAELATSTTDSDGNFWVKGETSFPTGARVGIRDASGAQTMGSPISVGACNQGGCHAHDRPIFLTK